MSDEPNLNSDKRRSLHVPPDWVEQTGYVRACRVRLPNDKRMAVGDVKEKYEAIMGENNWRPGYQLSPVPKGYWETDPVDGGRNFVIIDGRHRVVAAIMFGFRELLVRWNAPTNQQEI